ncbi:AI-2E family transporter [halophilic archaeon]|nr:AI-2E family transporter [halophilic archaeon]
MSTVTFELPTDRARIGWWLLFILLALAAAYIAYSFIGILVLGVFGYYATRPIYTRLDRRIKSDRIAAGVTVSLVLVPIVVLTLYAGFQIFQQIQQFLSSTADPVGLISSYFNQSGLATEQQQALASVVQNPRQFITDPRQTLRTILQVGVTVLSAFISTLLFLALAITLSYFLLEHDNNISAGLQHLFGGTETTAYAYATAIDNDLESVFFGNLLFIIAMSLIAAVAYWSTNAVAPDGLHIPMVFVLAFLTGVASLIPIVVGKLIYLPVVGYLGIQAVNTSGTHLTFLGSILVLYFIALDLLPQTFLQPYITGRQLNMVLMMFAYLLGPILFGWYGFFFLPIIFIVMIEGIRIVLPELIHGQPLSPTVSLGESVGTAPQEVSSNAAIAAESTPDDDSDDSETTAS